MDGLTPDQPSLVAIAQGGDPTGAKYADGTALTQSVGLQQDWIQRKLGGSYLAAAQRGNLFTSSSAISSVTLPIHLAVDDGGHVAVASTAGMINPTGSGVVVNLHALCISATISLTTLKPSVLAFRLNYSSRGGIPMTITRLTPYSSPFSQGVTSPKAFAYSSALWSQQGSAAENAQIVMQPLGVNETVAGWNETMIRFNGEMLIGPDTLMAIGHLVASVASVTVSYVWSEWPA